MELRQKKGGEQNHRTVGWPGAPSTADRQHHRLIIIFFGIIVGKHGYSSDNSKDRRIKEPTGGPSLHLVLCCSNPQKFTRT
ncbi:hypothetical protein Hanom_Chr03g00238721 [Helianthus anomalus]